MCRWHVFSWVSLSALLPALPAVRLQRGLHGHESDVVVSKMWAAASSSDRASAGLLQEASYAGSFDSAESESCVARERLVFLHIPKTAGTAVENSGMEKQVRWGRFMNFSGCDVGSHHCLAQHHEPPALMKSVNVYSNASVFCVVRNPFGRMISEYRHIVTHRGQRDPEDQALLAEEGCSARGMNEWLGRAMKRHMLGDIFRQGCHILPQSQYIWGPPDSHGEQRQYCHDIIRFEVLPKSFDALMQRYNYSVRLKKWNRYFSRRAGCQVSVTDINATNLDLVRNIYKDDFRRLNYSTDPSEAVGQ